MRQQFTPDFVFFVDLCHCQMSGRRGRQLHFELSESEDAGAGTDSEDHALAAEAQLIFEADSIQVEQEHLPDMALPVVVAVPLQVSEEVRKAGI